jgi:hypothetical protein
MNLKVEGDKELKRSLDKLAKEIGQESKELLKDVAKTAAKNLATATEPFGLTAKAKLISEKAVTGDIGRSFASYGRIVNQLEKISPKYGAIFAAYLNEGKIDKAERFARRYIPFDEIDSGFDPAEHQSKRNKKGRVPRGTKITAVGDSQSLFGWARNAIKTVGLAKAAWLRAGELIKAAKRVGAGIPAWLKGSQNAQAVESGTGANYSITLINLVSYAGSLLTPAKVQKAIKLAYNSQRKRMEKALEALAKKPL